MDRELLITKNNYEINKLAAKCLRVATLFLISLWLFSIILVPKLFVLMLVSYT